MRIRLARWIGLLLLLPVLVGCGPPKGKVSGRVLYQEAPLPGGFVTLQPANANSRPVVVSLDTEGHFEATLPLGEVQVAVDNRKLEHEKETSGHVKAKTAPPPPAGNSLAVKPPGKYVPIPSKYYSIETSDLHFTVEPGSQNHDLNLK